VSAVAIRRVRALPRAMWNYVRAVMGDQAYERYLEVAKRTGAPPLSPREFYVESVERRYSTVSRCC
jgi:uncharacterized short protein YbdD (DUF466 family)